MKLLERLEKKYKDFTVSKIRYNLSTKYKWFDWIDDNLFYYLIDVPKDWYKTVKHWFYCNWNREHWELLKTAFTSYGWDHSFSTKLEEKQIDKQLKWFSNHQMMVDEQYEQIMRTLKLAKYCVHLMLNDYDLYHFTGEISKDNLKYYYDGPRVNHRNLRRFMGGKQYNVCERWHEHDLYMVKIKHLYYKIKEEYSDIWWD